MKQLVPVCLLVLFLCGFTSIEASGQTTTNQITCSCEGSSNDNGVFGKDGLAFGLIVAAATAAGGALSVQIFARRNHFLNPYKTWLIHLSGALTEFAELCGCVKGDGKSREDCHDQVLNPVYLISHIWLMHHEAEEGYKWLAMVKRENPDVWNEINKIFDAVDILWHSLELHHPVLLAKHSTSDELRLIIRSIANSPTGSWTFLQMTMEILYHITKTTDYEAEKFEHITKFISGKTPYHFGIRSRFVKGMKRLFGIKEKPVQPKPKSTDTVKS